MRKLSILILMLSMMLLFVGCSDSRNPVVPGESHDISTLSQSDRTYPGMLGAWKVLIDTKNMTAEIIPARNAAKIGDCFDADLSQFLTVSPCENCLSIAGIQVSPEKNIYLKLRMRHPFTNRTTRPDLHGFDVRAIFIVPGSDFTTVPMQVTTLDGTQEDARISMGSILNAEGYTSHYDELIDDTRYFVSSEDAPANLNPYLRFFESWSMGTFDPQNPTGYNVMPVGQTIYERTVVISGESSDMIGLYIVADVAYGQSAVLANRTNPQYYLPAFNRTEPWRMEYWIENNNLVYDDETSTADLVIQVFDWQHNAAVDPAFPNPANLGGLRESSKVASVEVHIPCMMTNPIIVTTPESGNGTPSSPLQYRVTITNELECDDPIITGYVAIRDELDGAVSPSGRMPIPESPSSFPYATSDIRDYSYYGVIKINDPSEFYLEYDGELWLDQTTLFDQSGTNIDCEFFMDESRKMFQYRWDFSYDGVTFNNEGGGLPSPWLDLSTPGKRNVALRVRTNSVPPREYIYEMPAYGPGLADERRIDDTGITTTTSEKRSNAVALYDDTFYVAYVGKTENIYLARYKAGELLGTTQITTDSNNIQPAIAINESGYGEGVYLAWVEHTATFHIQTNRVNLDGTGLDPSYEETVPATEFQTQPCLLFDFWEDEFYLIFQETKISDPPYSRIASFRSTDYADTWGNHKFIEDTATKQYNPSAAMKTSVGNMEVVWEDERDESTLGTDLYMASSSDTLTWYPDGNILHTAENIDEYSPSLACYSEITAIAYLSQPDGSSNAVCRIHINTYYSDIDQQIEFSTGTRTLTDPSVGIVMTKSHKMFYIVSYSLYDSSDDTLQSITRAYTTEGIGWNALDQVFNITDDIGTVDSSMGASSYPGIACQSVIDGNAFETYIVRKTYEDGFDYTFPYYYGKLDVLYYIADGDDED